MSRRNTRKKSFRYIRIAPLFIGIGFILFFTLANNQSEAKSDEIRSLGKLSVFPDLCYGINIANLNVEKRLIAENEFFADILMKEQVPYDKILELIKNGEDIFDVKTFRAGKKIALLKDQEGLLHFIYDPSLYYYIHFDIQNGMVKKHERPITKVTSEAQGKIESNMWNAIMDAGLNPGIASAMEDAFAWSVDMYHVQKGDRFNIIFEEEIVDGIKANYGKILAGRFYSNEQDHFAILFDSGKHYGYFDLEGRPMRKAFLKSPVKYGRISSSYNPRRFHPILKRVKPHLGTDYAAAHGTPIQAVAAGTVTKAAYSRGNGKYVKMRHDKMYETQYLHMSKFAKGIKPGVSVQQGQIIGYVGSTGLATGPHVCFRFWKNGRQVNHLREQLPPPEPMPSELLPQYYKVRDQYKDLLEFDVKSKSGAEKLDV